MRPRWDLGRPPALGEATELCRSIVRTAYVLGAIAVAGQVAVHLFNGFALDSRYDSLNPDRDGNTFSWASSSATFGAALGLFLIGIVTVRRLRFGFAAGAVAFLSLDDALAVHERISRRVFVDGLGLSADIGARLFPVIYAPLLLYGLWILVKVGLRAALPAAAAIGVGLAGLGTAIGLELLSGVLTDRGLITFEGAGDILLATAEEGSELGGWILIAGGLLAEVAQLIARSAEPADGQPSLRTSNTRSSPGPS